MNDLPDDLSLLLALDVLLDERHVTRAARRLGMTQSAMSQRLARLRDFFGDPLLAAGRPLLAITPRAEAIRAPLARALADLRAAVKAGAPFDPTTAQRRFVVLSSDLFEALALPAIMPSLSRDAPGLDLSVERSEPNFLTRLETGTADLAVLPQALVPPSLRHQKLVDDRFVVLMRQRHPAARGALTLERYLSYPHLLVAPRGMPGSLVDAALERKRKTRRVAVRIQHFTSVPFLLEDSDLLLTCPELVATYAMRAAKLALQPCPLDLGRDIVALAWHERAHRDPAHIWLRSKFAEMVGAERRAEERQKFRK